jgi:hypothetical protein
MRERAFYELARHVEPEWSGARADRVRSGIARRAARRRAATVVLGVAAAGALAVLGARARSHPAPVAMAAPERVAPPAALETRQERPATTATPLTSDTEMEAQGKRAYVLRAGTARFVVQHDERHPFTVRAGEVLVEDVGTVFTVAFTNADRVEVSVSEGSVRVSHDGIASSLSAGQHIDVAAHARAIAKAPPPAPERARSAPPDEVASLLRAADDARAAGDRESALDPLRRVVERHPNDSRAGLAAFTLGRVLSDELHRPKEAADAFATARAHGGPMAADALGREVVARARAGEKRRAAELGAEYVRLYPRGDRVKEVERITGTNP